MDDGIALGSSSGGPNGNDDDDPGSQTKFDIDPGSGEPVAPVQLADPPPPSASGGTLSISADASRVYAADPDRDLFFVVDRHRRALMHIVELEPGCEPGRVAEDEAAMVHVACRRSGEIITIEPESGEVRASRWACHNPRGLMIDPTLGATVVACAEGVLATLYMDGTVETIDLGVELRDVVELEPRIRVSTFRHPSVITLDAFGDVLGVHAPAELAFQSGTIVEAPPRRKDGTDPKDERLIPNAARRTIATDDGGWLMFHQAGSTRAVEGTFPLDGGWGAQCTSAQNQAITRWTPDDGPTSVVLQAMPVAFDFAVTDDAEIAAVVGPFGGTGRIVFDGSLAVSETVVNGPCAPQNDVELPGDPTSVAFDPDRLAWVQLREPAGFAIVDPDKREVFDEILIDVDSIADTGYDLFHQPTEALVACVSCHPEGREDGMTWSLTEAGFRRTQALDVELEGGAPFHWIGDMENIHAIFRDVRVELMHGLPLNTAHAAALERYVFSLPPMSPVPPEDPDAVARGEALFAEVGCAACHNGPRLSNEQTVAMAQYGALQVPTLKGVRYRAPYMHDGRSADLHEAVLDMLAFSLPGGATPADRDDIVAYLRSL